MRYGRPLTVFALLIAAALVVWSHSESPAPADGEMASVAEARTSARAAARPRPENVPPRARTGALKPATSTPAEDAPTALEDAVLEGTVVEADGAPAKGCSVLVTQEGDTLREQSDQDGRFSLIVATNKDLTVTADCGSHASAAVGLRLGADHQLTLRLAPRRELRVSVQAQGSAVPIAGARVQLLRGETAVATATSDGSGLATLHSAAFADRIRVTASGHVPQELPPRAWGEARSDMAPLVVRLAPSATLTVAVTDERGSPVRGATVRLAPLLAIRGETFTAITGAEGTVVWDDLPRSTFEVEASHPELGLGRAPSMSWSGARPEHVQLTLGSGPAIAGRVLDVVREPVPGATVVLTRLVEFGTGPDFTVRTDAYGRFRVAGVGRGGYVTFARHGALASAQLHVQGGDEDVELTLQNSGNVEGRIVTHAGHAVPGARLSLRGQDVQARPRDTRTDARGFFRLEGLGEGRFELSASRALGGARVNKTVSAGEHVVLELPDEGVLRGRIRTSDGRQPPSSVMVSLVSHGERVADVRAGGEFRVAGVPPGTVVFEVRAPGYSTPPLRTAIVSEGRVTDMGEVLLTQGLTVEGTVVDEQGRPVAEAIVHAGSRLIGNAHSLVSEDAAILGQTATARTGPDGRFRLEHVPAHSQLLVAEHATLGRSAPVMLSTGAQVLKLIATGRLSGTLQLGGRPTAGLLVIVNLYGQRDAQLTATTDASGAFQVHGLPAGEHLVSVSLLRNGATSTRALKKVKVAAGESATLDLAIPVGEGSVRVQYRDIQPAEARPHVTISGAMMDSRLLSAEGTVTFSSLAPGAYNICLLLTSGAPRCSRVNVAQSAEEVVF